MEMEVQQEYFDKSLGIYKLDNILLDLLTGCFLLFQMI